MRARILQEARRMLVARGYRALSVRALAGALGYSPAAIYLYFPGREALARELCLEGYRDLLAHLRAALRPDADAASNLRACLTAYVRFGLAHPDTYRLIFMEEPEYVAAVFARKPPADDDPAAAAYRLLVDVARAVLRPPSGANVAVPDSEANAVALAEAGWAAMHGIVSLKLSCPGFPSTPAPELGRQVVDGLLAGAGARGKEGHV